MGFLNPGLLGLLGLGAVPVIIHLLNRRRYQVVAWPAMEFLLRAQVKTRKRLRMENLLLLLARTLAVLCFCLAATRPYLPSAAAAVGLQPERTHLYIVIDNSASMAYEEGMSSLLQRAVRKAQEEVDRLENDDPVSVILSCDNLRRRTGRPVALLRGTRDHSKVRDVLQRVLSTPAGDGATGASDARLDPSASLSTVLDVADPADPRRVLRVYSDFQRVDWAPVDSTGSDESTAGASSVRTQLERLKEARFDVNGAFVAVPEQSAVDVGVLSVETQDGRTPSEGVPTAFEVVVANHGAATAAVDVRFRVDDREIGTRRIEVRGRASGSSSASTGRATFPWTGTAGVHVATAEVTAEGNRLQRNDLRRHAFEVRDRVRVLAVDGDPNPGPGRFAETRLLETALSLSRGVLPMDVRVIPSSDVMREEFDDTDVVLLANVDRLTDATWERLRRWVRTGGGLWIFLGDKTDPSLWNGVTRRSETEDLLPARLEARPRLDADSPLSLELGESSHPSLKDLTDPRHGTSFEPPLVAGWWPVQQPLEEGVEVLLRFRDLDRTPALLERRVGRGRVMLCTTAADLDWAGPSLFFAPWVQETVSYLASAGDVSR
ncbi:MAG: BatA domain-containing protein, partial [Planctomycetota bacterium]